MSEPIMIIEPCAGLGNRLLGLGSACAVAQKLNRKLVVIWKREVGCNVRADALFSLPMEVVEISENGMKKEPFAQIKGDYEKKKWRRRADCFLECGEVEDIKKESGYEGLYRFLEAKESVYLKSFGPICEVDADSYRFLKPSRAIEEKGAPLFQQLDKNCVGVHVRRTDHTEAIANSPIELFAEQMSRELAKNCNTRFFVATDDKRVRSELQERLPEAKLIFPESGIIDRNSGAGVEDALIEMLALSKCRKILGSYNSTFSLLASYMGGIPLEVVKK